MCGILGFNSSDRSLLERMTNAQAHRGPDGAGFYLDDQISLGHNLLAITDNVQAGRQPFYSADKNNVLVYNGEIYNYLDLKKELARKGHTFEKQGDTEVLLTGLQDEGPEFLKKLNGMFAFAFYDKRNSQVLLARDRMGMKPLYYYLKNGRFVFASEMRTILEHPDVSRTVDREMLSAFFELGYIPGHRTLFADIHKLVPGQYATFNTRNKTLELHWFSASSAELPSHGFDKEKFGKLMSDAVFDHTMGLRPFGMYLSGGLDSTAVLYELVHRGIQRPVTYTTRFDVSESRFNEDADVALRVSKELGADHHELLVREADFIAAIPKVISAIEEPRYHPSIPAYYLLAQEASKKSVVILTGDGGDELYLGYPKYRESWRLTKRYKKYPDLLINAFYTLKNVRKGKIPLGMYLALNKPVPRWWYLAKILSKRDETAFNFKLSPDKTIHYLESIGAPALAKPTKDPENAQAELDRLFWLAEDSLIMTDKIGMHFGMESRFPYIDKRVVEFAAAIPSEDKLTAPPGTKGLIRQAYEGKLPDIVTKKRKTGWTAPVTAWMKSGLGDMVNQVLSPDYNSETRGLFDFDLLRKNIKATEQFTQLGIKSFFPAFTFQIWAKEFKVRI